LQELIWSSPSASCLAIGLTAPALHCWARSLVAGLGVVSLDQAYRAIDFDTITLLLGMMMVWLDEYAAARPECLAHHRRCSHGGRDYSRLSVLMPNQDL
jgi:hypothetical protein